MKAMFAIRSGRRPLATVCLLAALLPSAHAMEALNDQALSSVQGRDGMSFDLSNFALTSNARITYYTPGPSPSSLTLSNLSASRSDDPTLPFADPFRLDIRRSEAGLADFLELAFPINASGNVRWQAALDWNVNANGISQDGGSVVLKDAALLGGGIQLTTPRSGDGFAWGLALGAEIGNLIFRPRGRDDVTQADPAGVAEQMNMRGIRIGAVDANGNLTRSPWRIADVSTQPGILRAEADASGTPRLRLGIDWPGSAGAPAGGMSIDNISFKSDMTGNLDLGSSRIGSMQIQYLDIRFRP
ncbi:hypothetical protein [Noviherbaspirillum galbum]|uniref:Uncharacterized protein n=1 Tax=Noviherbaspirillum galbum TaxID=2709383 RepID=A0A6B3STB5_9BURK|nr:hypothetical protein [Noviherbaspirillum galbum]NEX64013.1 hypothetical protein [Noviherbaspirillum galbum]